MVDDLKGPSVFEIRQFIKDKIWVDFYTLNDKSFKGQIIWFDGDAFHLSLENGQELTLLKETVVFYNKSQ